MAKFYDYNYGLNAGSLYNFKDKEKNVNALTRYMLDRTQSMFEYDGLPETIPKRELELLLQRNGFACIAEHNGELFAYFGGLGGEPNVYYMPTLCVVSNPAQNFSKEFVIDKDCVIISNDSMYVGLLPMFTRYASALMENELSMWIADINSRIISLISAPTDELKKSGEEYLRHIINGDLSIFGDATFLDGVKTQPFASAGTSSILTTLTEYEQYLKGSFYNELGLNANYNMKRESLNSSETGVNEDALMPLIDNMLECRKIGVDKVNKMFGTNINVDFSSTWKRKQHEISERSEEPEETEPENLDAGGEEIES